MINVGDKAPETRMLPIAPPWAVAMAQIVSWFIIFSF